MNKEKDLVAQAKSLAQAIQVKPLLRGWFHAVAAVATVPLSVFLCWQSRTNHPRLYSLLIFCLATFALYTTSAIFHLFSWRGFWRRFWHSLDHSNIFLVIAGTYTPFCVTLLEGWVRVAMLVAVWVLAASGVTLSIVSTRVPRWLRTGLYIGMGWIGLAILPVMLDLLPGEAILTLIGGGVLYTVGAVIYALRWPNPFPRFFGFHEIFHLFVIAGSCVFALAIWFWVLPYPV